MAEENPPPEFLKSDADEFRGRAHLPVTGFLYTLDQIATILNISVDSLQDHVRFMGINRSQPRPPGMSKDIRMKAVSVMPSDLHRKKEWRVSDIEVERYLKAAGFVVYERKVRGSPHPSPPL